MANVLLEYCPLGDGGQPGTSAGVAPIIARAFFQLIDGRLHLPTIRDYFKLSTVRLNDVVYSTDSEGFTFGTFPPTGTIRVTGEAMPSESRAGQDEGVWGASPAGHAQHAQRCVDSIHSCVPRWCLPVLPM
jgi:hypothetical protein